MAFLDLLSGLPARAMEKNGPAETVAAEEPDDLALLLDTAPLGWAVERLPEMLGFLDPSMNRDGWFPAMCGVHHEWAGTPDEDAAFDAFDEWSAGGTNYAGRSDVEANWRSLGRVGDRSPVTLRTVLKMAKERGYSARDDATPAEWRSSFRAETMAEAASAEPPEWLVHETLSEGTVNLLLGAPGNGKTLVAMLLAISVASGIDFAGRDVRKGPVVYLAAENPGSIRRRLTALRCDYGDVADFYLLSSVAGAPDLRSRETDDAEALIAACLDIRPVLVIVDTFAAATPGADENSGKDMGEAYAVFSELAAAGAVVLVLHHPRKGGIGDARGHGSQVATVATALSVEKLKGEILRVSFVKARDASPEQVFLFRIEVREIGTDRKGRQVSAPTLVAAEPGEVAATLRQSAREIARAAILPLANRAEGVTMAEALAAAIEAGISKGTAESQRRAAGREIKNLVTADALRREGDRLFSPHSLTEADADEMLGTSE